MSLCLLCVLVTIPELPEVQTTVSQLKKQVEGAKITRVWTDAEKLIKKPASFGRFKNEITGSEIENISRRAKYIIIHLSGPKTLVLHQRMTGHLLLGRWKKEEGNWVPIKKGPLEDKYNKYIHVVFWLDSGQMLALSNLRKFATLELYNKEVPTAPNKKTGIKKLDKLGCEPLTKTFTFEKFKEGLQGRSAAVKKVLMDQKVISGIGNIYSDEILWEAKVSPEKGVKDLTGSELERIYVAIPKVLEKALRLKGTSIVDYRMPSGQKGGYGEQLKVYKQEGEKCPRCGGKIKRVKIGGRSAHYCPQCQKAQ